MKKLLFILLLILPFIGFSQETPERDTTKEVIFTYVEDQPEFPDGNDAMMKYLNKSIRYPSDALEKKVQGIVYVNFVVSEIGEITKAKVIRGISESIDKEALRVVNEMPTWKPGTQNGKAVKVSLNIPINFKLN